MSTMVQSLAHFHHVSSPAPATKPSSVLYPYYYRLNDKNHSRRCSTYIAPINVIYYLNNTCRSEDRMTSVTYTFRGTLR